VRIFITFLAAVATFTDSLILTQMPAVFPNERVVILVCGANTDASWLMSGGASPLEEARPAS